MTAQRARDKKK